MTPAGPMSDETTGQQAQPHNRTACQPSVSAVRGLLTVRVLALVVIASLMLRLAWIGDDSLITLRGALNITHGWGPGFNAVESVQAYTHPLWFLLWVTIGSVTNQWILGILVMSVALATFGVALILWSCRGRVMVLVAAALLLGSNAFMEYATSGLENPLAYVSVGVCFALIARSWRTSATPQWQQLVLLGLALAATFLTRFDLLVLVAIPSLGLVVRLRHRPRAIVAMATSTAVPVVLWFAWSWVTYSTLLPNTFAAKRNLEIPVGELIQRGTQYLAFSARWDLVTGAVIIVALTSGLLLGSRLQRLWSLSIMLYVAYVVLNGGDFMAGRFLAVPLYTSVALIVSMEARWTTFGETLRNRLSLSPRWLVWIGISVASLLSFAAFTFMNRLPTSLTAPSAGRWNYEDMAYSHGIADERGVWVGWASRSMWDLWDPYERPVHAPTSLSEANVTAPLSALNDAASSWPARSPGQSHQPRTVDAVPVVLGTWGIQTGPTFHLVDPAGLTDRFLAERKFVPSDGQWRPGHFFRAVPEGYLEAVRSGDPTMVKDSEAARDLAILWRQIRQPNWLS